LYVERLEDRTLLSNTPVLVKDINPRHHDGLFIPQFTSFQGETFFSAEDGIHGIQLWKTDGTASGTVMVTDINPSEPYGGLAPYALTVSNGKLFFTSGNLGGLWETDGTPQGTIELANIGVDRGTFTFNGNRYTGLVNFNNELYFFAFSNGASNLWKSDGTVAGTVMVTDKVFTPSFYSQDMIAANGTLYFSGSDNGLDVGLWKSDGTADGTVLVKDLTNLSGRPPVKLTDVGGTLYFTGVGKTAAQLWKSDGTEAGTILVKDIRPNFYSIRYNLDQITDVNGRVFFTVDDGVHGNEVWTSDGTAAGTVLVKDINPGKKSSYPFGLTAFNGEVFFRADDPTHGDQLWKSDGTAAGTVIVKQMRTAESAVAFLTPAFGELFFQADDGFHGRELWKTDGTAAGTVLVKDLNLGRKGLDGSYPQYLTNVNGTLYFVTHVHVAKSEDWILWRTNGTAAGTLFLKNFGQSNYSPVHQLTAVGDTLFFTSSFGGNGRELWKSDGTEAGTTLVADINPGKNGSYPYGLTNINGTLYFSANDGTHGGELWKSDGTAAGTVLVADINPGSAGSYPFGFTLFNGAIYFAANDGVHGSQLWKTDGTAAGTVMVSDISSGLYAYDLKVVNGTLYFSNTASSGELWKSDGTTAGTVKVIDVEPGNVDSPISSITALGNLVLFQVEAGFPTSTEIWSSDGTAAGTVKLFEGAGTFSPRPAQITPVGNLAYFVADDSVHGSELWQTDGTPAGTGLNSDLFPGPTGSNPNHLINANGTLFFSANDSIHGDELFEIAPSSSAAAAPQAAAIASAAATGRAVASLSTPGINAMLPASPPAATSAAAQAPAPSPSTPAPPVVSPSTRAADQFFTAFVQGSGSPGESTDRSQTVLGELSAPLGALR
jgi:ELWxxDGT repeat protein